nr:immunoglobulin heavy chain junction region [Mus musculus]
CAANWYYFDYW